MLMQTSGDQRRENAEVCRQSLSWPCIEPRQDGRRWATTSWFAAIVFGMNEAALE
jgi:hypothetical protein